MTDQSAPELVTEPRLLSVLEQLRAREPIFHRPEFGTTQRDYEAQLSDDFWEVGASGRRYSREFVLSKLAERAQREQSDPWQTSEFHCRELAAGVYALTYTLRQPERATRRLTIWRNLDGAWKIVFHQGTVVAE